MIHIISSALRFEGAKARKQEKLSSRDKLIKRFACYEQILTMTFKRTKDCKAKVIFSNKKAKMKSN